MTGGAGTIIAATNSFGIIAPLVGTGILVNYGAGDSVEINNLLFNVTGTAIEYRSGSYLNIGLSIPNTFNLGAAGDIGIALTGGDNVTIQQNTFDGAGTEIILSGGSTGTTINNNNLFGTISGLAGTGLNVGTTMVNIFGLGAAGDIGIDLTGGDNADIFRSTFTGTGTGISITGSSDNTEIGDGT